jgi:hypothetical protein
MDVLTPAAPAAGATDATAGITCASATERPLDMPARTRPVNTNLIPALVRWTHVDRRHLD